MPAPVRTSSLFAAFVLTPVLLASAAQAQVTTESLQGLRPREIGPAVMSGRIVDLAVVEQDTRVFYVAVGDRRRLEDRRTTASASSRSSSTRRSTRSGDIEVHQRDTSVVWVGTGERANRQSLVVGRRRLQVDRRRRDVDEHGARATATTSAASSCTRTTPTSSTSPPWDTCGARTTSAGSTSPPTAARRGDRVLYVDQETGAVDVAMDPSTPYIVYAAMYQRQRRPWGFHGGGPGSGLYKSTDGGETWTKLTNAGLDNGLPTGDIGRIGITIYRSDPRIVYVSVEQGERYNASTAYEQRVGGIFRSEDRGETWTFQSDWNPRPMYASQPMVDPNDDQRIYMLNAYSYSDDAGKTFTVPRAASHARRRPLRLGEPQRQPPRHEGRRRRAGHQLRPRGTTSSTSRACR